MGLLGMTAPMTLAKFRRLSTPPRLVVRWYCHHCRLARQFIVPQVQLLLISRCGSLGMEPKSRTLAPVASSLCLGQASLLRGWTLTLTAQVALLPTADYLPPPAALRTCGCS